VAAGPIGLLFLGDSITALWPASSNTWKKFEQHAVANFAVPGERTEDLLWRVGNGELDGIAPKAVVLLIGTNNLARKEEQPEWVAGGIRAILDVVQAKIPAAKIILVGLLPRGEHADDPLRARVKAVNAIIATYAVPGRIIYLDFGDRLLDDQGNLPKAVMPDFLHPSGKGFAVWDKAMWPILSKLLE
jgi:beta-glucosidase